MKNLLLISLGLCAFAELTLSKPNCIKYECLSVDKGCSVYASHPITVPETNNYATCTGEYGAGKFARCCATEADANSLREQLQMKELARAIAGAEENEYPHQVHFRTRGMCGGTVYNKNWIITAAHCVRSGNDPRTYTSKTGQSQYKPGDPFDQAYVIAGTSHVRNVPEANKYTVDKVIWHEQWNPNEIGDGYDIALLHLAKPLALEKGKIQPLRLEPADYIPNYGGNGVSVGFGNVNEKLGQASDDLMEFMAPIHHKAHGILLSFETLNAAKGGSRLNPMTMAIGGGDSGVVVGEGDSGGPFICGDKNNKPILCGISSYKSCDSFKLCRKPSYFQRVAPMLKWIKDNTNNEPQEESLIFDEPLLPEKVPDKEVHPSLVRLNAEGVSCTGIIVTKTLVLTTGACSKALAATGNTIILHLKSETTLVLRGIQPFGRYEPSLSENVTKHLGSPIPGEDMGFVILGQAVPAEYIAKLAPDGYKMKGRSVEYTYNQAVSSVEKRNYLEMDKENCAKKLSALDSNLKLTGEQLCMRQVYSAEKDCKRDFGGALMCENGEFLCGIGSFRACTASGFPEIFANYLQSVETLRANLENYMRIYA